MELCSPTFTKSPLSWLRVGVLACFRVVFLIFPRVFPNSLKFSQFLPLFPGIAGEVKGFFKEAGRSRKALPNAAVFVFDVPPGLFPRDCLPGVSFGMFSVFPSGTFSSFNLLRLPFLSDFPSNGPRRSDLVDPSDPGKRRPSERISESFPTKR